MTGSDDSSVDYFHEGFDDLTDDEFPDAAKNTAGSSPRSAKRRRLDGTVSGVRRRSSGNRKSEQDSDDGSPQNGSDSFVVDDDEGTHDELQSPSQDSYFEDAEAPSKYKVFIPKRSNIQENIFVTQLTQPPSPPEMIRGPRWKKPEPSIARASTIPAQTSGEGRAAPKAPAASGDDYNDDDLNAAIAASLESFENEQSWPPPSNTKGLTPQPTTRSPTLPNEGATDTSFLLEDIPDDAFDSDLSLSPPTRVQPQPATRQFSQSSNRPLGIRQTSLFDMTSRNQTAQPPLGEQVWSPPEKDEPPTQHKLDQEALSTWVYPTNLGKTRDYQFNIAQKGLFHNLLVALPTGLGKTFIAATIMLNWFRWTQSAQIIFVAPTKPLVAQQISACFGIAGIPRSQTTMLTGEAAPGIRAEEWQNKRVFFMTPQTLINDLKSGIADPKRIVLLVVDEAHRATGGYAYVEVVKFLRRYNQSFRVLALTATPGSTVESVQAVIDGLDIARVEIRTEQSLDIREYVHTRNTEVQTFKNSEEMVLCMDLLSKTLQPLVDQLRTLNAYWGRDPMMLTAFGLTKSRQQWMASDAGRNAHFGLKGKVNAIFTVLASLAHAIDLLKYHGITPFYRHLLHFQSNTEGQKGGKYQRQVVQDESFKKLMSHLQPWTKDPEFIGHPKLEYLKSVVLNHFMDAGEGSNGEANGSQSSTRIMIFVHFRDSAEEVTRVLKRYEPMIRPHVFVGQSSAKGSEGMGQKTQLSIVQNFKKGTYNTIVATSIGEEGLDIGEVDLIVCYDSSASPIRMLQRMGRTGRKRAGNIVLLLMEGKEEESYIKAKDNYEKMQQMIASGSRFTFHDDISPRILPAGIRPVADKRQIDIPDENAEQGLPEPKRRGRAPKRPPKKFHMPDNVETGFTKASSLAAGPKSKAEKSRKPRTPTPEPVEIPALEEVVLTSAQQRELEQHYRNIGATSPQFIRNPRNDAFPRLQLVARPTKVVKHGSLTRRMIGTLRKMNSVSPDCEERFKKILALESARQDDSVVPGLSPHRERRRTLSKTKPRSNHLSAPVDKETPSAEDSQPVTPEQLLSSVVNCQKQQPFYSSQKSKDDDSDDNFDPPDLATLLTRSAERNNAHKTSRFVVSDDSDG
ncbi:ATP-dependent DNA helicase mph1 [Aspergillus pseudotamarii]|uniref:ATP-dependent DNA helicase n=1 Tax=Aspergillus pseudotamarii TaxID=132259 RepID=A0A5N6T340_ASPPS|nr:ATP-dependent DNA helicase mph1 [Aspergillus pseudotamarii]KAE8140679.1 ATP-dependent DNA helicase mph1 [Aspergillus pseudotamarii]